MNSVRYAAILPLLALFGACGQHDEGAIQNILIPLSGPQSLDPALIDRVEVAAVQGSTQRCVAALGSNACTDFPTVAAAELATGFAGKVSLRQSDGSTASFSDLSRKQTCFVAEALSATDQQLAVGCADVALELERHKIEIVID